MHYILSPSTEAVEQGGMWPRGSDFLRTCFSKTCKSLQVSRNVTIFFVNHRIFLDFKQKQARMHTRGLLAEFASGLRFAGS
jgi:hypothetical protein